MDQPIKRQVDRTKTKKIINRKNKTHKKLILKMVLGINTPVTRITVFETNEGTANGVVRLWERAKAERFAVANDALS